MADAARRRYFAARASIAKRQGAATAGFRIVPPAGTFMIRIEGVPGVTTSRMLDDETIEIRDARLFHGDDEIDGTTVIVDDEIADDVRVHLQFADLPVEGEAVRMGDGYCLVTYHQPDVRMAA